MRVHNLNKDQKRTIQAARIPVDCWNPEYTWIVSLSSESLMPTELELRQLRNLVEFKVKDWYNLTYQHKLLVEQPLAKDSGTNTLTFMKGWANSGFPDEAKNGWHYRRLSWTQGPLFVPAKFGMTVPYVPLTLVQCFDRIQLYSDDKPNPRWEKWKAEHADLYSVKPS